jgi:hypothetical protein
MRVCYLGNGVRGKVAKLTDAVLVVERFALADGVGFEPTVGVNPRRFSRPVP